MNFKMSVRAISLAVGIVALCAGCATNGGNFPTAVAAVPLSILYETPSLAEELGKSGIKDRFSDYWQAHASKNWKLRYELEKFPRPLEEKFYVAYHANAWSLRSVKVTGVQQTSLEVTVDLVLSLVDPEKKSDIVQYQKDKWVMVEGSWRHVVQDPMLTGSFQ